MFRIPVIAKLAVGAGGAGLLALAALGAATPALAAATPNASAPRQDSDRHHLRQAAKVVFDAEASVLGMKPEDLRESLRQGKTVSQLAGAAGMNEQQFGQKVAAAAKPGLDKLVDDQQLTAAQVQRIEQRLSSGQVPLWNGLHKKTS